MRTRYFEYAKEVAKCGSITKAAELYHISQQALSEAIKLLEIELGFQIFIRSNKGVKITENGEKFLADLDVILPLIISWRDILEDETPVKIYLQYILNDLIMHESLRNSLPNVDWEPCSFYDVLKLSKQNNESIGIFEFPIIDEKNKVFSELCQQNKYKLEKICTGHMCVILQKDDPLCKKEELYKEDFLGRKLIVTKTYGTSKIISDFIENTGVNTYFFPETINVMTFLSFAEKGSFTYMPEEIIKESSGVKNGELIVRYLEDDEKKDIHYCLLYHEKHTKEVQKVLQTIKSYLVSLI